MGILATNGQVRHVYFPKTTTVNVSTKGENGTFSKLTPLTKATAKTTTNIAMDADGEMYFEVGGAATVLRTDLITRSTARVKLTEASKMSRKIRAQVVTLDPLYLDAQGKPIEGEDYILRVAFNQYIGSSDEDEYFKYGVAHVFRGMTESDLYLHLAASLAMSFSRDMFDLVNVYLTTASDPTAAMASSALTLVDKITSGDLKDLTAKFTGTYTGVVIKERPLPYERGTKTDKPVVFNMVPSTVVAGSENVTWGIVNNVTFSAQVAYDEDAQNYDTATYIKNGRAISDLEWASMAMRGDMYKNFNWPDSVSTTYLSNPNDEYDVIDIHYYKQLSGESVQKSEKDMTFVVPKGSGTAFYNKVVQAINA